MKQLYFFIALCAPCLLLGQISYGFEQTAHPYANLAGATVVQNPKFGSGDLHPIDLTGETFWFYRLPFTFGGLKTFHLQTNGNIRIDNDSSTIIVDAAFIFLDSIDNQSQISYKVDGSSGSKVVKVEWKNLRIRTGAPDNFINVQVWVYQATGVIELRYGPSSASNANGYAETGPSAGINVGMFYAPDNFTKFHEKIWLNNHPSNLVFDTTIVLAFRALKGVPPPGTVYRFVPRFSTVGIKKTPAAPAIQLYPNPASNVLNIPAPVSGYITDVAGRHIIEFGDTQSIDISSLQSGTYLLYTAPGAVTRFVKQ